MRLTPNLNLKKPEATDTVDIDDLNANADTLDVEVTRLASSTEAGRMSAADKVKLTGIAAGAQVNRAIATQAQAQAGTDNTTDMTPLRAKQLLNTLVDQDLKTTAWPQFDGLSVNSKLEASEGGFASVRAGSVDILEGMDIQGKVRINTFAMPVNDLEVDGSIGTNKLQLRDMDYGIIEFQNGGVQIYGGYHPSASGAWGIYGGDENQQILAYDTFPHRLDVAVAKFTHEGSPVMSEAKHKALSVVIRRNTAGGSTAVSNTAVNNLHSAIATSGVRRVFGESSMVSAAGGLNFPRAGRYLITGLVRIVATSGEMNDSASASVSIQHASIEGNVAVLLGKISGRDSLNSLVLSFSGVVDVSAPITNLTLSLEFSHPNCSIPASGLRIEVSEII